ncbi:TlpA family protein disulfide reductase [Chryseobacterium sp.]|uniref:TlpA family protein disulfide reductase n=1 Tax=Chryseobacterium sp. TaxID=1871047 RepID=UPI00388D200D
MKKIILTLLFTTALLSCKKEAENTTSVSTTNDSIDNTAPSVTPEKLAELKSLSPEKTTEFLQTKNDTLYVTNFFATWCGPCVREIPHFKEKSVQLAGKPVKITFLNLDTKEVWNTEVPAFVDKHGIRNHTILLDGALLDETFFKNNFKTWTGDAIPFTYMRKGDKTDEYLGLMSQQILDEKIKSFDVK